MIRAGWLMGGFGKLSDFVASFVTQVRVAMEVSFLVDDSVVGECRTERSQLKHDPLETPMWGDAPGRVTRNGLDSFEIGAGKTRIDE